MRELTAVEIDTYRHHGVVVLPQMLDRGTLDAIGLGSGGLFGASGGEPVCVHRIIYLGLIAEVDRVDDHLGRVGYDPVYGARPLKRAVQRYLQDPLAEQLLGGEIPDGSTVKIDEGDGALKFNLA